MIRAAGKKRSLRRQTALLVIVSLLTLLIVQALYLTWFSDLSEQRAIQYAHDNLGQVSSQLDSMFEDVRNITFNISFNVHMQEYLTTQDLAKKYLDLYPLLSNMLEYIRTSNNDVYDILLFDLDGNLSLSRQQPYSLEVINRLESWHDQAESAEPRGLPAIIYGNSVYYPYVQTIYSVASHNLMQKIGDCIVLCNGNSIQRLVGGIAITKDAKLFVVDMANTVIASNQNALIGTSFDSAHYEAVGNTREKIRMDDGNLYIVQFVRTDEWTIFSLIPSASLLSDFHQAIWIGLIIGLLAAVFLLLTGGAISHDINTSVGGVVRFLQDVRAGNETSRIGTNGPVEIQVIESNINQMLDRLEDMTVSILNTQADLYEAQLMQRQASFTALQRQINPHFLFNTLNCISTIAAVRNAPEIVTISASMANIFRYCIKGADIVAIEEEIACVRDYLSIIHLRYQGKIRGEIDIEAAILQVKMPKMILQPIVENAVFHGLEPKRGGGLIRIQGRRYGESAIEFTVEDDGKGMDAETLATLEAHLASPGNVRETGEKSSIGLMNILSRVRFLFGESANMHIESQVDEGSRIILRIPIASEIANPSQTTEELP